jgi:hypothetical protein
MHLEVTSALWKCSPSEIPLSVELHEACRPTESPLSAMQWTVPFHLLLLVQTAYIP